MIDYLDYPINWKAIINKIFRKVIRQKISIQRAINSSFVHQQRTVRKCNRKRYWGFSSRSKCVPMVRLSPTEMYIPLNDSQTLNPKRPPHVPHPYHCHLSWVLAIMAQHWLLRHLDTQSVFFFHKDDKQVASPGNLDMCCTFPDLVTIWVQPGWWWWQEAERWQYSSPTALLPHSTFQNLPSQTPLVTSLAVPASPPHPHPWRKLLLEQEDCCSLFTHSFVHAYICVRVALLQWNLWHLYGATTLTVGIVLEAGDAEEKNQMRSVQEHNRKT